MTEPLEELLAQWREEVKEEERKQTPSIQLASAIKWMIFNNTCIDWGEDIPYMVADILGEDGFELWKEAGRSLTSRSFKT